MYPRPEQPRVPIQVYFDICMVKNLLRIQPIATRSLRIEAPTDDNIRTVSHRAGVGTPGTAGHLPVKDISSRL